MESAMGVKREVFAPLDGAEHKTAIAAIEKAGLDPSEFVLEERCARPPLRTPSTSAHKLISVKRLTNGTQRQYGSGRGGGWPYEFERDLRMFFYGRPNVGGYPRRPGAAAGESAAP
jgi:hypothetical protein